jgi:hypothetical protein
MTSSKTWGLKLMIVYWIYTNVIRPMLMYAAVVQLRGVCWGTVKAEPGRLQKLAHISITGAVSTAYITALKFCLVHSLLFTQLQRLARALAYWLRDVGL